MGPRLKSWALALLGAALSLSLAVPAVAETPQQGAKGKPVPEERQAPPQAPDGCPFRGGKLELIA